MAEPRVSFVLGGVQKAGTTALAALLSRHPQVALPDRKPRAVAMPGGDLRRAWLKEAHVFDDPAFDDGWTPADIDAQFALRFSHPPGDRLHGDATPLTLYHPRLVARVRRYNPAMRWIVLLRDPVERAISHYFMERSRGHEPLPLLRAVLAERGRLAGTFDDFARDAAWRRHSYVDRGRYRRQLAVLHEHFPAGQVLVLRSEALAAAPLPTAARALAFLGLDPAECEAGPPPRRVLAGGYAVPGAWSPGRLLLRWLLRGEVRALTRYGPA